MKKRWNFKQANPDKVVALQKSLNIHPAICQILVQRGIETFEEAREFFCPSLKSLHCPWKMKDMDKAVKRIRQAIQNEENILIYGDYDVDGTTAVACMYSFLKKLYPKIDFYIPHRFREGYGVSKAGIDFADANGFRLIISLDCGIKSCELVAYAASLGIDFIVCDHHLPDKQLPPAVAILNPKQPECPYPYKELCGCGIGYKLISALAEEYAVSETTVTAFLDLVATAVAADIVPMTGENRILAYHGLLKANRYPHHGIKVLKELSGLKKELDINSLVFMIAPRVNAAGRMDDATKAVRMFISATEEEALHYARMLHSDNANRKEADSAITHEALALIEMNEEWKNRKSTVVYQPHWHKGVVGIVASRLIEYYHRPTVVLTRSGNYVTGSARSVPGFNLYEAIHACRDFLLGYGGHFAAAGLTLELEKVDAFREKFEEVVSSTIAPEMLIPQLDIDAEIRLSDIQPGFYNIIRRMEPFGPENMKPVFIARNVVNTGSSRVVKEDHIRFSLRQGNATFSGIGFDMAEKFELLNQNKPLDIVFKIEENEWNGQTSLQLKVLDFMISSASQNANTITMA
ncbi:MAG: single-stranded-DNA-specific exonuclease RecJ [Chitinophagaceae bacterium]|nr:single-stranded-DNA-specific exonuclease RecJ [Chitinophagaceae bacterium]